jgi:hypothetical protein
MGRRKPAEQPAQPALPLSDDARNSIGPGLNSLLQGPRAPETETAPRVETGEAGEDHRLPRRSVVWTLAGADVLLVVLAIWIVVRGGTQLEGAGLLLAIAAVALGAWLGCCAVLLRR